jgi:anti-sigma B factor antagonist
MSDPLGADEVTDLGVAAVARVAGELDATAASDLRRQLVTAAETNPNVIVDLSGVPFIDSSGLSALLHASWDIRSRHGTLVLAGAGDKVRTVLAVTRLDTLFTVVGTVDEALRRTS